MGFAAFVQGFAEVGEDVFLGFGEVDRGFDVHGAVEVACGAAAHGFDAFAFEAEGFAGLGFRRHGEHDAAAEGWYFEVAAKGGGDEADGHGAVQVVAFAGEDGVFAYADFDVEVARRRAAFARFAFAGEADAVAAIDACRDVDVQGFLLFDAAVTVAVGAGVFDDLAFAAALRAGLGDGEEALLHSDLAGAAAAGAVAFDGFFGRAGAATVFAADVGRDADAFFAAVDGFFEREVEFVGKVMAACLLARAAPVASAAEDVAEDVAKDVGVEAARTEAAKAAATVATGGVVAVAVVGGAFLFVREDVVGGFGFFEFGFGFFAVVRVAVGVVFHRQFAERFFDFVLAGGFGDAEDAVEVFFCHGFVCDGIGRVADAAKWTINIFRSFPIINRLRYLSWGLHLYV